MNIIKKKKLLKVFLLIGIVIFFILINFNRREEFVNSTLNELSLIDESCSPVRNIAYLKTYKCASTSLQNALFRYGLLHNLTFAIPASGNHFGPRVPFKASMIPAKLRKNLEINIFAIHTVWVDKEIRSVMPNDTIFFSAVREPTSVFKSLYTYAQMSPLSINDYIRSAPQDKREGTNGYNGIAFDFGVPHNFLTNRSVIEDKIKEIEINFDLILVVERLDESLILLRKKLCWTYRQVAVLKHNAISKQFKISLEDDAAKKLRYRLRSDYMIYDHFVQKFDALVLDFGKEKMQQEIIELKKATNDIQKSCGINVVEAGQKVPNINEMYSNKVDSFVSTSSEFECFILEANEDYLVEFISKKQNKQISDIISNEKIKPSKVQNSNLI